MNIDRTKKHFLGFILLPFLLLILSVNAQEVTDNSRLEASKQSTHLKETPLDQHIRRSLLKSLEQDYWALATWIDYVPSLKSSEKSKELILFYLKYQREWLQKCTTEDVPVRQESVDLKAFSKKNHLDWRNYLKTCSIQKKISYFNINQKICIHNLEDVVRNVFSYGAFIRGQLFHLALADGKQLKDLPNTSPLAFLEK